MPKARTLVLFARGARRRASIARLSTEHVKTVADVITENRGRPAGLDWNAASRPIDLAACLELRPELANATLTFDSLQFPFDQGAATSVDPLCGIIDGFLTEEECARLIDFSTSHGYEPAKVKLQHGDGRQEQRIDTDRLHLSGRVVIESQRFADLLWERLAPLLPVSRSGWEPVGLNEHFRFLRYRPGNYFRAHRDANYVREETDPRHGEVSFQSLLLYLDSPSKGGETFFPVLPTELSKDKQVAAARRVKVTPRPGRALCFDHVLEHGGADMQEGVKHVIRTDVIYRCLPGTVPPKWITAKRRYMT